MGVGCNLMGAGVRHGGMRRVVIVGALGVLAAGCGGGTTAPSGNAPGSDISGQVFLSRAVTEQGRPRQLVDGTRIRLKVTEKGELRVQAGCNHMSGPVDTGGARLSTPGLSVTDMGCDKARHDQDQWLSGVLSSKPEWKYDGTTLTLRSGTTEILFAAKQPATLEGTTWVADTIIDKDVARPLPTPAWITFTDGTVSAGDGCNSAQGQYQATPEKITFREVASTLAGCPQAGEVLPVLDGDVPYRIQDETLTLTRPSGHGLQLKAGTVSDSLADKQYVSTDGKARLKFSDGKIDAGVGCNDLTGAAAVANGKLVVPNLSRTRKACEPALMEREDRFVELLKGFPEIQVTGTGLRLTSGAGELVFRTG